MGYTPNLQQCSLGAAPCYLLCMLMRATYDDGIVSKLVRTIKAARSDLNNATSGNNPNHPGGKTPPWLITEFGASCNQGFGDPSAPFFPAAIHDMIDQSSYTIVRLSFASLALSVCNLGFVHDSARHRHRHRQCWVVRESRAFAAMLLENRGVRRQLAFADAQRMGCARGLCLHPDALTYDLCPVCIVYQRQL